MTDFSEFISPVERNADRLERDVKVAIGLDDLYERMYAFAGQAGRILPTRLSTRGSFSFSSLEFRKAPDPASPAS